MTTLSRTGIEPGVVPVEWWQCLPDGRVQCDLCPRFCKLREGQRGFCFIRQAREEGLVLTSYGRASGFCLDPIEEKQFQNYHRVLN
jgi:pyruvate formate lyase activating enzyme